MIKVLFICHGNICRSPLAQSVLTHLITHRHLTHFFEVNSAATSREEIGNPPHRGTAAILRQHNIPLIPHRAVQLIPEDYQYYNYLVAMDDWNIRNLKRLLGGDPEGKVSKLLDYTERGGDIADPWYTGDFEETYKDVLEGCEALLEHLMKQTEGAK